MRHIKIFSMIWASLALVVFVGCADQGNQPGEVENYEVQRPTFEDETIRPETDPNPDSLLEERQIQQDQPAIRELPPLGETPSEEERPQQPLTPETPTTPDQPEAQNPDAGTQTPEETPPQEPAESPDTGT